MLRTRALALPLLLVLTLAGCGSPPLPRALGSPSVFASAEEALAAAIAAYERAVGLTDEVGRDGGEHPERLSAGLTGDYLLQSIEAFEYMSANGLRMVGFTNPRDFELDLIQTDPTRVHVYVCEDISNLDVIGPDGRSIVSADRVDVNYFRASFEFEKSLKLAGLERWDDRQC